MSGQVRRSLALALVGLLAGLGLVAALFGGDTLRQMTGRFEAARPPASRLGDGARALADPDALARKPDPSIDFRDDKLGQSAPGIPPRADAPANPARDARSGPAGKPADTASGAGAVPRFDIVRVEPNGDAVVAGQGAPHAVVEMLVNGKPVARATADASGQFAVVPPALPAGSSQIRLRMTGKDGRAAESEQSVAVDVAPGRDRQPLVALTAPDAATVVLSQPGAPGPGGKVAAAAPPGAQGAVGGAGGAGDSEPSQPPRIASVDVQANGRLFITATGMPGAMLRLYLNDTLIAPGRIGPDGRASFTIGRGVRPGQYQVRIDQIDPATGKVATRAEVPLSVPEPTQVAAREVAPAHGAIVPGHAQGNAQGSAQGNAPNPAANSAPSKARSGNRATQQEAGQGAGPDASPDASPDAGRGRAQPDRQGGATGSATGSTKAVPGRAETPASPDATAPGSAGARTAPAQASAEDAVGSVYVPEISTTKISRGDNLWRISQRTYGRGERYTVIYDANQTQIRDPDLIYPGQIFVLPSDKKG